MSDDCLAGRQVRQRADHGDEAVVARRLHLGLKPLGGQARDGEAVLGVLEGDPLDERRAARGGGDPERARC